MISLPVFRFQFTPSLGMTLCTIVMASLLTQLGIWQLHRAAEKHRMLYAQHIQAQQPPLEWLVGQKLPAQYQSIRVHGQALPMLLLLDNQHQQHLLGYDMIVPVLLDDNTVVLVDYGWIVGDPLRAKYPSMSVPKGYLSLSGQAYYPSNHAWLLGSSLEIPRPGVFLLERMDVNSLRDLLHKSVYPFMIRLQPNSKQNLVRNWPVVAMSPARHYGYALQWFVMAGVIVILYVVLNMKKKL